MWERSDSPFVQYGNTLLSRDCRGWFFAAVTQSAFRFSFPTFYYTLSTPCLTYRAKRQLSPTRKPSGSKPAWGAEWSRPFYVANWSCADGDVMMQVNTLLCRLSWKQWDYLERLSDCQDISISHRIHKQLWARQWQLVTDWLYFQPLGRRCIQLPPASPDCCMVWHFSV